MNELKDLPVGVFDSGVGGLTVVKEIRKILPAEDIIYVGDTARCPYGPRPLMEVRKFAFEISEFLVKTGIKALVVACNTASAAALSDIRDLYRTIPVLGVVEPGARAAVSYTRNKKVGVIGTVGTISSGAYEAALKSIDPEIVVISKATPELVDFVERGEFEGERIEAVLHGYLDGMVKAGIDTLILGCTHYPLIAHTIQKVVGENIMIVSSAEETARDLARILFELKLRRKNRRGWLKLFATNGSEYFLNLGREFLNEDIREVERISF